STRSAAASTNHRAAKSRADFERPTLAHPATPAGPLTSTQQICLDSRVLFTLCSQGRATRNVSIAWARNDAASLSQLGGAMSYRIVFWSAVGWIVLCLAPYVYALNDLLTWR